MKEKELRLALVCYGGVSLAVYMHGISKEIQKLVRASRIFHTLPDVAARSTTTYDDLNDDPARETDTERVYFDLLNMIGAELDLRVFVDVIAGASAGGINGIMLARALAHDLPLDTHRNMWLSQADITALMDEKAIAGKWSKAVLKPLFWDFNQRWISRLIPDEEAREKASVFLRSRWFKPPFSGKKLCAMLLDAARNMEAPRNTGASLIPSGHRLELFVTTTDFYGFTQKIPLHDPEMIEEREHRHVLRFSYLKHPNGTVDSDFDGPHIPGLVFAARATSCFPGAFPPMQIGELSEVMETRGEKWTTREDFLASRFQPLTDAGVNPLHSAFIDGSVLNNKPFAEAITALRNRPAFREVDRRIVYIDPDPNSGKAARRTTPPGFFRTILGALSDIPRNEPVRDELDTLNTLSARVYQYREVVEATRASVSRLVEPLLTQEANLAPDIETLADWRHQANTQAVRQAGYAYNGYIQIKVLAVLASLGNLLEKLSGVAHHPSEKLTLSRSLEQWARSKNIFPVVWAPDIPDSHDAPEWIRFLRHFDREFRARRLRFVIRRLNELYQESVKRPDPIDSHALDDFKRALYEALEHIQSRKEYTFFGQALKQKARQAMAGRGGHLAPDALDTLLNALLPRMGFTQVDREVDEIFSIMAVNTLPEEPRRELLLAYLGFPFFDVLTFPFTRNDEIDDIDTIQVDRISPVDARMLNEDGATLALQGRKLVRFGAFFSRTSREHDYLWGRLQAAERLVDIVSSTVENKALLTDKTLSRLKHRLFLSILASERKHLIHSQDLIDTLDKKISVAIRRKNKGGTRRNTDTTDPASSS